MIIKGWLQLLKIPSVIYWILLIVGTLLVVGIIGHYSYASYSESKYYKKFTLLPSTTTKHEVIQKLGSPITIIKDKDNVFLKESKSNVTIEEIWVYRGYRNQSNALKEVIYEDMLLYFDNKGELKGILYYGEGWLKRYGI